jgi:hypothetical protein
MVRQIEQVIATAVFILVMALYTGIASAHGKRAFGTR